jgi:hypothetical protein
MAKRTDDDTDDRREAEAWAVHDGQARIVYDAATAMLATFAPNGFTAMSIGEGLLKAGGHMLLIGAGLPPPSGRRSWVPDSLTHADAQGRRSI